MKKMFKKIVCLCLVIAMFASCVPFAQAAFIEDLDGTYIGTLESYIVTVFIDTNEPSLIKKITVSGNEFDVEPNLITIDYAQKAKGKEVVFVLSDGKITKFSLLSELSTSPTIAIQNLWKTEKKKDKFEKITYSNGRFDTSYIFLDIIIRNMFNSEQISYDYEFLNKNYLLGLYNISVTLTSSNKDLLYFLEEEDSTPLDTITFTLDKFLVAGEEYEFLQKIYVNKKFVFDNATENEIVDIGVQISSAKNNGRNKITRSKIENIEIINNDFGKVLIDTEKIDLLEILNKLYSLTPRMSRKEDSNFANIVLCVYKLITSQSIKKLSASADLMDELETIGDITLTKQPVASAFHTALFKEIKNKASDTTSKLHEMLGDINNFLEHDDFNEYINWCEGELEAIAKEVTKQENNCPTDITVMDDDGITVLSIVNNNIEICDETINALVIEDHKYFYLPNNMEYTITITATDNGTMDHSVTECTPGGLERTISYYDVPLVKGESYTATTPLGIMNAPEEYNLIAENGDEIEYDYDSLPPVENDIADVIVAEDLFDGFSTELIDKVANAMFNFNSTVDITSYNIVPDDTVVLFSAISKYYPTEYSLLTKGDFEYKIIFSPSLGCITEIRFYYGDDANLSDFEQRNKDLKAEIEKIVAQVEGMNDFEKALYIHDYIVLNSEYDLELLEMLESGGTLSGELYTEKYSEYSILINGTGICGSYALAYRALMNAAGVDCLYLSSQQMNHAWNMVKIDGEWYHVDCCWDDPVPNNYGDARRTYFLRNDKEIMELNHYSWVPGYHKATSKLFSDMPRNYNSEQKFDSGYWYVSDNTGIFKTDRYGNNKETVSDVSATSIEVENGELYYSLSEKMFFYDQQTKKTITAYSVPDSQYNIYSERGYVKNFDVEEDVITYYLVKYSDGETTCKKYTGTNQKDLYEKVKKIDLQQSEYNINVFDTINLDVEIVSESENDYILSWESSNTNVASVTNDGVVRGNGSGTAIITVSYGDLKDSCEVVVTSEIQTGYCGSNVIWKFTEETGHLLITGTGDMYAFELFTKQPWLDFNIVSVEIGPGVTSVGRNAFQNKSLNKVILGKNIKNIADNAFAGCTELTEISFPSGLKTIGKDAFRDCEKLTSVYIPQSVTEIGEYAFNGIDNLESFTVNSDNTTYKSDEFGVLYSKDGTRLICFPENSSLTEYEVSSNVSNVEFKSFYSCENLEKISIKGDLTTELFYTFYECKNLKEIIFEGYLPEIKSHSFDYCVSLETIYVPDGVTALGDYSFANCESLTGINLPDSIKEIGNYCFKNCKKLEEIILPQNLERIGNGAFYSCDSLESLYIPHEVDFIQGFSESDSPTVNISDVVGVFRNYDVYSIYTQNYEAEDFWQTNFGVQDSLMSQMGIEVEELLSLQIPTFDCSNLKFISVGAENSTFSSDENGVLFNKDKTVLIRMPRNSSVKEYTVPDSVVYIAFSAFENCDNLQKVIIPSSVTYIGNKAFAGCDNLKNVVLPNTVDKIRESTFYNCSSLMQVVIPDSVIEIHTEAFSNCESLERVSIPESVTLLGYKAFSDCDNLKYVEFLGNTVGEESFVNCNNLEEVVFSDNVTCISAGAFADLPSLEKIVWSNNLREIQVGAFKNCDSIVCVVLPDSIAILGAGVFEDCDGIVALSIGSGISEIRERTFQDCDGLQSVLIPRTVNKFHATAFHKCDSLEKMAILNPSCTITTPGFFSSGYFDYITGMSKKICTLWGYSGSTAEDFSKKTGGFVANFKPFTEETHIHEFFAIEYDTNETSENKQYHNVCYCGFHNGELVSGPFNCELGGFKGTRCTFCGLEQGETVEATQHHFVFKNETFGTCVNPGAVIYECSVCKHTNEVLKVADEGHSYTETITSPTCTEIGYTTATCEYCGENAMYDFVPMLGHDITVKHTDADCKKYAQDEYSCNRCNYYEIIVDENSGFGDHKTSITVTESTCTANGSIDQICVTCNELISSEETALKDHIPGEWKTVTEATTESAGKKEQRCDVCSELLAEEEIPKIPVYVSNVELGETEIEIVNKSTHQLYSIILPDNADDKSVVWSSDNEKIVMVDENGVVTACSLGKANITVTTTDGGFTATCEVTVIPREFNVTWIVDGKKIVETFKEESAIIEPKNPEKEGYSFVGWTPDIPATMPDNDIEFTATWLPNSYDAVFNANGGKWADGAEEKTVSTDFDSQIIAPEAPEKQGYIFSRWTPDVGSMDDVNGKKFSAVWIASTDTTYTVETYTMNTTGDYEKSVRSFNGTTDSTVNAEYEIAEGFALNEEKSIISGVVTADNSLVLKIYIDRNKYKFTTIVDGVSTETEYLYGSLIAEPVQPNKTGHSFDGWNNVVPATMPAKDVLITAIFTANMYDVIFNANDGAWADGLSEKSVSTEYGAEIIIPESPVRNGYIFSGWTPEIGIMDDINGKIFTAVWIASKDTKYTVETYRMNTAGEYEKSVSTYSGETNSEVFADYIVEDGFVLNGEMSIINGIVSADNSLALKVYIDRLKYKLITVVDGKDTTYEYFYGSEISSIELPSKTGFSFIGWSPDVPSTMPAKDIVITAVFAANKYDAVFNANGGAWSDGATEKAVSIEYGADIIVPEAPSRDGYVFSGWTPEIGVMDDVNGKTFTAIWIAATDTKYTVETYTMNTSGEYEKTSQTFSGATGESVDAEYTVPTGFTLNTEKSILEGTIAADNSLVLKVYIDRNTYTFTTVVDGVSVPTAYLYGAMVAEPVIPTKDNHKFIKWNGVIPETMPAENVTVTAVFEKMYICPDCGNEILGETQINAHISAEARMKATVKIKNNNGSKTIKYGETLRLTATTTNMPAATKIYWYVDGVKHGEGEVFNVNFENGTKTIEVKIVDSNGNVLKNASGNEIKDTENVTVKGGFFQKIISFFKNLFGMNRIVVQSIFKDIF